MAMADLQLRCGSNPVLSVAGGGVTRHPLGSSLGMDGAVAARRVRESSKRHPREGAPMTRTRVARLLHRRASSRPISIGVALLLAARRLLYDPANVNWSASDLGS